MIDKFNNFANLKVLLSAVGVVALLASPAMAKTVRHDRTAPSTVYIPGDAYGSVTHYGYNGSYGPYTPDIASPAHGQSNDFQGGGGNR